MRKVFLAAVLLSFVVGCPPQQQPLDPIEMRQAVAIVNDNTARITSCIKAEGSVSGHFVDATGHRQHYDLHASCQVIAPLHTYMSLKSGLGTQEMLLGSNHEQYWVHIRLDDDTYRYGTHAALQDQPLSAMPLRPDLVIEALGLNALPEDTTGTAGPVQRIVDEYQQLIFLAYESDSQGIIHKEYWLDRYEPRLVRRIIFRDAMGRVVMDSRLDDYRLTSEFGALLPHRVRVDWPLSDSVMNFRISRWKPLPERGRSHPAFIAPHERGQRFKNMIDLDAQLQHAAP